MKVLAQKTTLAQQNRQTMVVFITQNKDKKPIVPKIDQDLDTLVNSTIQNKDFGAESKETLFFRNCLLAGAKHVLIVGLGKSSEVSSESLRIAAATAYNQLKVQKVTEASLYLENLTKVIKDTSAISQALTEGLLLSEYEFSELKSQNSKKKDDKKQLEEVTLLASGSAQLNSVKKGLDIGYIIADCTNFSRRLGDSPGNFMTPTTLANETIKKAKGTGLKVTAWDKARIKKEKMGGLLGVSLGSSQEPRFIIMEYKGAAASKKPVVFVGKGLTFDSGGISIKPAQNMDEMKYDMCGGANVIGAMLAIAKLKLKVNAIGLVPASENMPGPAANKPGDVLMARNGKSFEVLNTDAEGRLILADALCYASEQKPAAIFDAATLTGAILVALGNTHTGVFTRDKNLMGKIQKSADAAGELVWPMPLTDHHVEDIRGTHADWSNIGNSRLAGSSTAAAFLEQFVEDGIPWAHFDIAGTAWNVANRLPYCPKKGASGAIVRTFIELAKTF